MSPIDWNAMAAREPSPTKSKAEELLSRWKGIVDRLAAEAFCRPDDKEGLEDDMQLWVRKWDGLMVSDSLFC
jgi:hypothetical protein